MIKKLLKEFTKFNNNIRKEKLSFIKTYASFSFSFLKHGSSPKDFFRYDFFKKDNKEKSIYMTYRRNQKVINNVDCNLKTNICLIKLLANLLIVNIFTVKI